MNKAQAVAKLRKLLGPRFAYRLDPSAPTAKERDKIRAAWSGARQTAAGAVVARDARRAELLAADERYQELNTAAACAVSEAEALRGRLLTRRVVVGRGVGLFFSVEGDGDNWQEVVDVVTAKDRGAL